MKRLTLILATALMMTACQEAGVPAIDKNNFDESVALKDNFYQWATGGWQKKVFSLISCIIFWMSLLRDCTFVSTSLT